MGPPCNGSGWLCAVHQQSTGPQQVLSSPTCFPLGLFLALVSRFTGQRVNQGSRKQDDLPAILPRTWATGRRRGTPIHCLASAKEGEDRPGTQLPFMPFIYDRHRCLWLSVTLREAPVRRGNPLGQCRACCQGLSVAALRRCESGRGWRRACSLKPQ